MTSTFRLALDTHAPSVVWGGATGATAGELLRVPYVSDEPLARAVVILGDGRRLTASVLADHIEVNLPPDAPDGFVSVEVRDDVGNTRTYAAVTPIAGVVVIVAPEPPAAPGVPGPRRPRTRREPEVRTAVVTSETPVSTMVAVVSSSVVDSEPAVSTSTATVSARSTISTRSESATAVSIRVRRVVTSDSGRRLEREALVRRRDSPDTELLLLL